MNMLKAKISTWLNKIKREESNVQKKKKIKARINKVLKVRKWRLRSTNNE